ncbi:MAG TPA: Qat anti-phage system QueC-like protein QatC [Fimbriimonadaceae bacterium]|nr:Qat anti-phage system QueC-like protein QatC [Fimbriimonadaceae bacterium]
MSKRVLAAKFGASDQAAIPLEAGEILNVVDFVPDAGVFGYGLGHFIADLRELSLYPTEIGFDLLILATLVYAADTRISRQSESEDNWTREIRLVVPVSDPSLWGKCTETLRTSLNFLTGDRWQIDFRSRPEDFSIVLKTPPAGLKATTYTNVSLFSGGMDSLIGALDELAGGASPLLVSHAGDGATSKVQHACVAGLEARYSKHPFGVLRLWLQFDKNLIPAVRKENTTRSRSFLFIAAAIVAGTAFRREFQLRVPENGLIALNVPLDPNRIGALSTRTTHPFYLARWSELLSLLGIPGTITNPYWDKTKGEMVANCADQPTLLKLLPRSLSCSSPTKGRWQKVGTQHCGYCLPCLIRRAAVLKGLGSAADPTKYTLTDLTARPLNTQRSEGVQIRSFQLAIERLVSNPKLARALIHKVGPLGDVPSDWEALADVYRRGLLEVGMLLDGVETKPL